MDLETFTKEMLDHGKGVSERCAGAGVDFIPTFIIYKGNEFQPLPLPHYTRDRQFHIGLMRAMIDQGKADGFVFVMEAWFAEYKGDGTHLPDTDAPNFVPPSQRTDREEMLLAHGMSREGGNAGYCCKIKRRGHKLTFGEVENMEDSAHGKSFIAMMGAMFGEKAN